MRGANIEVIHSVVVIGQLVFIPVNCPHHPSRIVIQSNMMILFQVSTIL